MNVNNLIGIALSVGLVIGSLFFIHQVAELRGIRFDYPDYDMQDHQESIFATLFSSVLVLIIGGLVFLQIKNWTSPLLKNLILLHLFLSLGLIFFGIFCISRPGHLSYDETGYLWMCYGILNTVFFFLLWRKSVESKQSIMHNNEEIIDDIY